MTQSKNALKLEMQKDINERNEYQKSVQTPKSRL